MSTVTGNLNEFRGGRSGFYGDNFLPGTPLTGPAGGDLTGTYPNPTLATVGAATGPVGNSTTVPVITIDSKGRVTALSSVSSTASGTAGGDLTGTYPNPTLATVGAATGPVGDGTTVPVVTIDSKGRVTALTSTAIAGGPPSGAAGGDLAGTYPNPTLAVIGTPTGPTGSSTTVPVVTIDSKGRVTALTSTAIATPTLNSQVFTANGTWTAPAGVTTVIVVACGGGGGGGGGAGGFGGGTIANNAGGGGAGGGAGGTVVTITQALTVVPFGSYPVTIGAGGAGGVGGAGGAGGNPFGAPGANGTNGANGGNTQFGILLEASGGLGGKGALGSSPYVGSSAPQPYGVAFNSAGSISLPGGTGASATTLGIPLYSTNFTVPVGGAGGFFGDGGGGGAGAGIQGFAVLTPLGNGGAGGAAGAAGNPAVAPGAFPSGASPGIGGAGGSGGGGGGWLAVTGTSGGAGATGGTGTNGILTVFW